MRLSETSTPLRLVSDLKWFSLVLWREEKVREEEVRDICELQCGEWTMSEGMKADLSRSEKFKNALSALYVWFLRPFLVHLLMLLC